MPQEYKLLYQSLVNQQVFFPPQNIFLNSSPLKPGGDHKPPASVFSEAPKPTSPPPNMAQVNSAPNGLPLSISPSHSPSPMSGTNQAKPNAKPQTQSPPAGPSPGRQPSPQPAQSTPKIVVYL